MNKYFYSILLSALLTSAILYLSGNAGKEAKAENENQFEIISSEFLNDPKISNPQLKRVCSLYIIKNKETGKKYLLAGSTAGLSLIKYE